MNLIYVEKLEYLRKQLANKAALPSYVLLNDIVHFGAKKLSLLLNLNV